MGNTTFLVGVTGHFLLNNPAKFHQMPSTLFAGLTELHKASDIYENVSATSERIHVHLIVIGLSRIFYGIFSYVLRPAEPYRQMLAGFCATLARLRAP